MKIFCTSCRAFTECVITPMAKNTPNEVGNQRYDYKLTSKCNICNGVTIHYNPE